MNEHIEYSLKCRKVLLSVIFNLLPLKIHKQHSKVHFFINNLITIIREEIYFQDIKTKNLMYYLILNVRNFLGNIIAATRKKH